MCIEPAAIYIPLPPAHALSDTGHRLADVLTVTNSSFAPQPPDHALDLSDRPALQRRTSQQLSFQTLAIFFLSAIQSVSGVGLAILHAYKQARDTIKKVNQSKADGNDTDAKESLADHDIVHSRGEGSISAPALPGSLSVPPTIPSPTPLPPTPNSDSTSLLRAPSQASSTTLPPVISHTPSPAPAAASPPPAQIPNYTHPPLAFLLTILTPPPPSPAPSVAHSSLATARALTHLLTLLGSLAAPFLARLLPYLLYTHLFSPAILANIIRSARRALFPEGWPAPPPVDPTPEEQIEMREAVRRRLLERVPGKIPLYGVRTGRFGRADLLLVPSPQVRLRHCLARHLPREPPQSTPHWRRWTTQRVMLTLPSSSWTLCC